MLTSICVDRADKNNRKDWHWTSISAIFNLVPRAMPVRGLGLASLHWLWGNGMRFVISLAVVRSIIGRAQALRKKSYADRFRFPRANANPNPRTGIALGTRLRHLWLHFQQPRSHSRYIWSSLDWSGNFPPNFIQRLISMQSV